MTGINNYFNQQQLKLAQLQQQRTAPQNNLEEETETNQASEQQKAPVNQKVVASLKSFTGSSALAALNRAQFNIDKTIGNAMNINSEVTITKNADGGRTITKVVTNEDGSKTTTVTNSDANGSTTSVITETVDANGDKSGSTKKEYDENGELVTDLTITIDKDGNEKKAGFETRISDKPWRSSNGDYGHSVIRTQYNEDGSVEVYSKLYSDVTGKLNQETITTTYPDGSKKATYKFYNDDERFYHQQEVETDKDGNKVSTFTWYDEEGNTTGKTVYKTTTTKNADGSETTTKVVTNKNGSTTTVTNTDANGKITSVTTETVDANGNKTGSTKKEYDENGELATDLTITIDKDGNEKKVGFEIDSTHSSWSNPKTGKSGPTIVRTDYYEDGSTKRTSTSYVKDPVTGELTLHSESITIIDADGNRFSDYTEYLEDGVTIKYNYTSS